MDETKGRKNEKCITLKHLSVPEWSDGIPLINNKCDELYRLKKKKQLAVTHDII